MKYLLTLIGLIGYIVYHNHPPQNLIFIGIVIIGVIWIKVTKEKEDNGNS
ncbi:MULTISPECIES: hypothetical protein [Bacillus cereus group]|nr:MULTISPECIES: hypothetical protein [Bacillus cereus group]EJQ72228.1 hypothetical protein IGK_05622 [Bacillus toyonensis]EOQ05681.1 hypothetical protein KQ3_06003 [Bacillus cereus B5-2]HDR7226165.1 hypothetical protein [Bacillus toyonensis]HDR7839239.1 hypothetical protein [Bacillus toyonensis]